MFVIKRNGQQELVHFDKITSRVQKLCDGLNMDYIDPISVSQKVIQGLYNGVSTKELDKLAAETCAYLSTYHPDWSTLAARIAVSDLHKNTSSSFSENIRRMRKYVNPKNGEKAPIIHEDVAYVVSKYAKELDAAIDYNRDFDFDYFGFKTLEKSYLLKINGEIVERPQQMYMRVAVGIHTKIKESNFSGMGLSEKFEPELDLSAAIETYNLMSQRYFTHATPTLYNAGTPHPQLSSCFLLTMNEDSVEGIFETMKNCAIISKYAGGIGLSIHDIRAVNSYIRGTNGISDGIVPMLRVFNDTARYINQGGKRKGSFAMYLEPWHADILDFLEMKKNTGKEEMKARDLFYAMWIPDLFMKRVEENGNWTLFCPNEAKGLSDVYGEKFEELYCKYESENRGRVTMKAQEVWFAILQSQIETGTPYLCYKDAANAKSNQKNLGTIKSSNLCVAPETFILTDKGQIRISELENQTVKVWNGDQFSEVIVKKTGENQNLIGVEILVGTIENGKYVFELKKIECTYYHKFIMDSRDKLINAPRKEARELKRGDVLAKWQDQNGKIYESIVWDLYNYDRVDDTYCFTEPLNNAGIFNGILTGNCSEILEYSSPEEVAVCNLASIALNRYVNRETQSFDFYKLYEVVKVATRNLNKVIDINFYPIPETRTSNLKHRPIGIGVQGLADCFAMLNIPFESEKAMQLNEQIFAIIYHAALTASCELAERDGAYETFRSGPLGPSPASQCILQFDLWNTKPLTTIDFNGYNMELNWEILKIRIKRYGLRNSLLLAPMPTASTAQILGNNESIEPFTSNIYSRRVLSGEFPIVNKHLLRELIQRNLWNSKIRNQIMSNKGSIQNIEEIPEELKAVYKTVWEIKQKTLIDLAASRGAYVCQSQSLNLFVSEPTNSKLSSMHFYAWKKGLKTGIYYLRTKPKVDAIQFTIDKSSLEEIDDFKVKNVPKRTRAHSVYTEEEKETPEERAKRRRQEIREAIARGDYDDDNEVCISCSG